MKCKLRKCLSTVSIILCFAMIYLIPMNVVALVQDNSSQTLTRNLIVPTLVMLKVKRTK